MGSSGLHGLARKYISGRVARREVMRDTGKRQLCVLATLCESFGNRDVKLLSRRDIERWMETRGHLAVGTRRFEISVVRGFCRWMQREHIIRHDPMLDITRPPLPRRVPRSLQREQAETIWRVLPDERARAIFALMRWCGLRRCEVVRLEVGDWNREINVVLVRGKGSHEREVPVPIRAAAALAAYLALTGSKAGPMIRDGNGRHSLTPCYVSSLMSGWMSVAGIKGRAHDGRSGHALRHTIAGEILDEDPDPRTLQEFLGHAHLSSTAIYLPRARLDRIRIAVEAAAAK